MSNLELENQEVTSIPDVQIIAAPQQQDLPLGVSSGRPPMLQIEPDNRTANMFNIGSLNNCILTSKV